MRILNHTHTDLAVALEQLSAKISSGGGIVSESSKAKTIEVFGIPLTPIEVVRRILSDVKAGGDDAVSDYCHKLDGSDLKPGYFRVTEGEMEAAYESLPEKLRASLKRAKDNIEKFQKHIKALAPAAMTGADGGELRIEYRPLKRVGVYVPGGRASYPSTALMTVVPAQVAGVHEIAMATPCRKDGTVHPRTLAVAHLVGLTEVYRFGGAQAIGALAYGTKTIRRVDKIVGPGNMFVTLAKREVYGECGLDMLAGPSEVLIIADETANPAWVAADMLSQAEHDPAAAVLLTPTEDMATKVIAELAKQLQKLSRAEASRNCLETYGFIGVTRDTAQAVELANQFAPEHLELAVKEPQKVLAGIRNAGAVFMGHFTPEPVGDYIAGPSHVLPTSGTARFAHGLNVNDFLRPMSVISYTRDALKKSVDAIDQIARSEGLDAHARSATIRFE